MSNPTSNFGWQMPTPTDLVTSLPADFEVFGQAVDSTLADLKGGTTGQVLSKNSNTDMDFVWVTDAAGDITGVTAGTGISGGGTSGTVTVTNSMATAIDAKGDLIAGTGADAFSRLAVGNNGETLVADSSTSTGLRYNANYAAGKNAIINGDFRIWQRGTSFASGIATQYTADRWVIERGSGTYSASQQTFTPGTAPVAGYEGATFLRLSPSVAGDLGIGQRIEDVRTFANQNVTISFWAKASTSTTLQYVILAQNFGSGGSSQVTNTALSGQAVTTSWARYSVTIANPSISGKTIGTSSFLLLRIDPSESFTGDFDVWGVQVEAGSVATAFQTATGTIQGELNACLRYLPAIYGGSYAGYAYATNSILYAIPFPVNARVAPTGITVTGTWTGYSLNSGSNFTPTFNLADKSGASIDSSGGRTITAGQGSRLESSNGVILFTGCEL